MLKELILETSIADGEWPSVQSWRRFTTPCNSRPKTEPAACTASPWESFLHATTHLLMSLFTPKSGINAISSVFKCSAKRSSLHSSKKAISIQKDLSNFVHDSPCFATMVFIVATDCQLLPKTLTATFPAVLNLVQERFGDNDCCWHPLDGAITPEQGFPRKPCDLRI